MRISRVFFVLFLVVAAVLLNITDVDCKSTIEKIEEEVAGEGNQAKVSGGALESWAEWAKDKLSFKSADDIQDSKSNANQDKAGCVKESVKDKAGCVKESVKDKAGCVKESVKDKACESAKEAKLKRAAEAYEKTGEAKDKVKEQVCDMGKKVKEESKKRSAEAEDTLYWAGRESKRGV